MDMLKYSKQKVFFLDKFWPNGALNSSSLLNIIKYSN